MTSPVTSSCAHLWSHWSGAGAGAGLHLVTTTGLHTGLSTIRQSRSVLGSSQPGAHSRTWTQRYLSRSGHATRGLACSWRHSCASCSSTSLQPGTRRPVLGAARAKEFSYSLDDIGRYYNAYEQLMDHWHSVLPGEILTVQHEDVLDDLEGQVKRILDFCGLDFEEACLAFHQTKRVIKTPSSEQVRQPIYKTGMGQWKPFENYLAELKQALGRDTSKPDN